MESSFANVASSIDDLSMSFATWTYSDIEAARVFSAANVKAGERVTFYDLTWRLMGTEPIVHGASVDAELRPTGDGFQIVVPKCRATRARWLGAMQLARWWALMRVGVEPTDMYSRGLAAALLAPLGQFEEAIGAVGPDCVELSHAFGVSQSLALLRIGEIQKRFASIVRPDGVVITSAQATFERRGKLRHIDINDESLPRFGLLSAG